MILLWRFGEACCLYLQGDRVRLKYILRHPPRPNQIMVLFGSYINCDWNTLSHPQDDNSCVFRNSEIENYIRKRCNKTKAKTVWSILPLMYNNQALNLSTFCVVKSHVGRLVRTCWGIYCPLFHCPIFHCLLFHCRLFHCPFFHCSIFHCPIFTVPFFIAPFFTAPFFIAPLFYCPLFHWPLFHCPLFHCPLFHCPLFQGKLTSAVEIAVLWTVTLSNTKILIEWTCCLNVQNRATMYQIIQVHNLATPVISNLKLTSAMCINIRFSLKQVPQHFLC